jgi:hypothetical protein
MYFTSKDVVLFDSAFFRFFRSMSWDVGAIPPIPPSLGPIKRIFQFNIFPKCLSSETSNQNARYLKINISAVSTRYDENN